MKKSSKTLKIPFLLIICVFFFVSTKTSAQIFTDIGRDNYNFSIEAGYQSSQLNASSSAPYLLNKATANGLLFMVRSNSSLLYGSFGKYKTEKGSYNFLFAGLETPVVPFTKSFGKNEIGILISLMTDYAKWERPDDSSNTRLDISSFGLNVGGIYKLKFPVAELTGKLSVGYGYGFQYIGQETGNEWVARFSTHILFPNVTDYFGISGSIFANYTNWDTRNENLKTTIMTLGITAGVAF